MPSVSSTSTRRSPQQNRSERRLALFLEVASDLFGELGYEATTMTAIAERSGTSIGGLYHYFPDKESIAAALLIQYTAELEASWEQIVTQTGVLTHAEFANLLLDCVIRFIEARPAYLQIFPAKIKVTRTPEQRQNLRTMLATAFQAQNPTLTNEKALRAVNVSLQIIKGMKTLYSEAPPTEKPQIAADFKEILTFYLSKTLSEVDESSGPK